MDWIKNLKNSRPTAKEMVTLMVTAVSLGLLGPFGTFEAGVIYSLLYWIVMCLVGYALYWPFMQIGVGVANNRGVHAYLAIGLMLILSTIPMTLVVMYANHLAFGLTFRGWDGFIQLYPFVGIIGIMITGISLIQSKWEERSALLKDVPLQNPGEVFLKRLPVELGTDLICIVMEDHYLRVYTDKGEHLLLLRLKDALEELGDYSGLQVHRSWWVSEQAVIKIDRKDRKVILTMINGVEIPVSRTYQAAVKAKFRA